MVAKVPRRNSFKAMLPFETVPMKLSLFTHV